MTAPILAMGVAAAVTAPSVIAAAIVARLKPRRPRMHGWCDNDNRSK